MNMLTTLHIADPEEQFSLGFNPPETTSFDEWRDMGRKLCMGRRAVNWLIGDWLIWGSDEKRFGRKALEEANAIFLADVDRFGPIVDTCRRFPETRRHAELSFGHHLAVMTVDDDGEAERLLAEAEAQRMTAAQLKATVRVSTDRQVNMLEDDDPEDAAMRRIVHAWNRSPRAARQAFLELAQESHMGVIEL
jgi:hypothetical protein